MQEKVTMRHVHFSIGVWIWPLPQAYRLLGNQQRAQNLPAASLRGLGPVTPSGLFSSCS